MTTTRGLPKLHTLLDWFERITIVLLFAWLSLRIFETLDETPYNAFYLVAEGAVAVFVLFRRATEEITIKLSDWIVGFVGTMLPMLIIPSGHGWSDGFVCLIAGTVISLGAKFSLRRSFGVVAANRGIKCDGLYAVVRHPMYLGYFLTYTGVLLLNPSSYNLALLTLWTACQIARIVAEESVLLQDATYKDHTKNVRFRLVPFVY